MAKLASTNIFGDLSVSRVISGDGSGLTNIPPAEAHDTATSDFTSAGETLGFGDSFNTLIGVTTDAYGHTSTRQSKSYVLPTFPTPADQGVPTNTGVGASGTWGINITGSAGSVAWGSVTGKPSTFPNSDVTAATDSATANTLMKRNASGDVWCRLFRSNYSSTNSSIAAIYTTQVIGGDYMRPSTPAQVKAALNITPADIGAEPAHSHPYLPLSGGTLTGTLFCNSNVYFGSGGTGATGALRYYKSTDTYFRNYHHGANIYWQGEDAAGTNRALFYMDPDSTTAGCQLFCRGTWRLYTTTSGINVNGTVSATEVILSPGIGARIYSTRVSTTDTLHFDANDFLDFQTAGILRGRFSGTGLTVVGNGTASDWIATSDIRLKNNIAPLNINDCLNQINKLVPSSFTWKESGESDTGLIAQQVQEVLPERVKGDDELAVSYAKITTQLIGAVKALTQQNEELTRRIEELEAR